MECEEHYPLMRDAGFMRAFELTMTYKRDADIPLSYADPRGAAADMFAELRRPPPDRGRQAPLLASFISSSHDRSGRQAYHRELARHLPIDCYGAFMRNRTLVPDLGRQTKLETLPAYKFAIAFENARAEDYVTEKFFDPLRVGCVPVYLGAPNVEDFAPGDRCFIDAADYADPRALADHLLALSRDDDAYASYFEWKRKPLRRSFARVGLPFLEIAPATADRIAGGEEDWGHYYHQAPWVCAGIIATGASALVRYAGGAEAEG